MSLRIIRKTFEIKSPEMEENCLKGNASVMGVMDSQEDVIFPGAFKPVLTDFKKNGFVALGHNWRGLPIAYPDVAREEGNVLYTEAYFHTTEDAQAVRTVCRERIDAGLSVGLSVGFMLDWTAKDATFWFENGEKLLEFCKNNGYDMTLFDSKGIKACKNMCRGIAKIHRLMEYSVVTVPANPYALATDAKGEETTDIYGLYALYNALRQYKHIHGNGHTSVSDPMNETLTALEGLFVGKSGRPPQTAREWENFLRDVGGMPNNLAKRVINEGFKTALNEWDAQNGNTEKTDTDPVEDPPPTPVIPSHLRLSAIRNNAVLRELEYGSVL